ncbi:Protein DETOXIFICATION 17 [Dichanthelium oligosanthes]|uniref:Protein DETOXIFICATION 17 n=1 Tax=Dichanthelium oligosanthes TaxID=888268 RepID=A0A1E5W271_9POAL|nr:Protein DETOXIFICATION 17 [Dichanthelium oligosanthes]
MEEAVSKGALIVSCSSENTATAEDKRLLRLAGPLVASCILQNAVQMVSIMFVSHLGELPLAGASLAISLANVTGFSILVGMASALNTLCRQAFGAQRYSLLGVYRLPAVRHGGAGARVRPDHRRLSQRRQHPPPHRPGQGDLCGGRRLRTVADRVSCPVRPARVLHSGPAGMGAKGAELSSAVAYCVNLATLCLYVRISGACKRTWTAFSMEAFRALGQYTDLAIPSAMMLCLEWWSFELVILLSGLLPNPKLETSVLSICLNTSALTFKQ